MPLPPAEFETLLLGEVDALYRLARRLTRSADRAEDLVQETIARALRNRDSFAQQGFGIKPWLLRVMYHPASEPGRPGKAAAGGDRGRGPGGSRRHG